MKLMTYYEGVEIHRESKIIYLRFLRPHRVLSSSRGPYGGMRDDLEYLYNHQCCEPSGHEFELYHTAAHFPHKYQEIICGINNLPSEKCADLCTAANMNNAAIVCHSYEDLEVTAVVTGGVETNAARAGDPAFYHRTYGESCEASGQAEKVGGTINTMICTNLELTRGAMVQAVITATEAKTVVLQELGMPSRYSQGYATGTGTDQIGIASMLGEKKVLDAGKHSKMGELIGRTAAEALRQTLKRQNGLHPESRCSVFKVMERLGVREEELEGRVARFLKEDEAALFRRNFPALDHDPQTVAAVSAIMAVWDKTLWGILPNHAFSEMVLPYLTQVSLAVSGDRARREHFEGELAKLRLSPDKEELIEALCRGLAIGFEQKWKTGCWNE
jgi:adenosylcobinamide amidohydrolase